MALKVGFIGLGAMGAPMARNLLAAGFEVAVHNRSLGKAQEFGALGARVALTPAEAAHGAEIVITMLPDGPDVLAVITGENGVLDGMTPGALIVDMSTIAPSAAQAAAHAAAQHEVRFLDAPVSGGDVGAREGTLAIMVGGDAEAVVEAQPVFDVLGSTFTHCGSVGSGQIVKACNQLMVAAALQALADATVLSARAGVDPEVMMNAVAQGLAGSRVLQLKGPKMASREFAPGFRVALHLKDLNIALAIAQDLGIEAASAKVTKASFEALLNQGNGDLDHSAVLLAVDAGSGSLPPDRPTSPEETQ